MVILGQCYRRRPPAFADDCLGSVCARANLEIATLRLVEVVKLGLYVRLMAKYSKGDMVVSVKDIGGVMRDFVPKGTEGVVVEAPWFGDPTVLFTITGALGGKKQVRINVSTTEIR